MFANGRLSWRIFLLLAALAVVAYLPLWRQPLLEDDYPNIMWAQRLGAPSAYRELASSVFRLRATSCWLMDALYQAFGMGVIAFYASSILLHVLNVWLVYGLGSWPRIGYRLSAAAAAFFAVYEGHQEAVMWFSACNELLLFAFGIAALLCALRPGALWYAASLAAFSLALLSKESAFILLPFLLLANSRRPLIAQLPFILLTAAAVTSIYASRGSSFRFEDGSFSLNAPFVRIWIFNSARLLWFWGIGLFALVCLWRIREYRNTVLTGLACIGLALMPYSFLTYSLQIPSRQTYLASLGLAWIVGAALVALHRSHPRAAATALALLAILNIGYLWTRKRLQFQKRAEPTEQLIAFANRHPGPIHIRCFPRGGGIPEAALLLRAGLPESEVTWQNDPEGFCYKP